MVGYCLDTSIVVAIFRGDIELKDKIERIINMGGEFFVTPITLCELYVGAYSHQLKDKKIMEIRNFVSNYGILDFDLLSCEEFGKTYIKLENLGKMTEDFDLMISSIAKTNDLILITRNKKHFENTGVEVEIW